MPVGGIEITEIHFHNLTVSQCLYFLGGVCAEGLVGANGCWCPIHHLSKDIVRHTAPVLKVFSATSTDMRAVDVIIFGDAVVNDAWIVYTYVIFLLFFLKVVYLCGGESDGVWCRLSIFILRIDGGEDTGE